MIKWLAFILCLQAGINSASENKNDANVTEMP